MKRRIWIIGLVAVAAIGWYLFRPELLFLKTSVNESLPAETQVASAGAAVSGTLLSGRFHSVSHETKGSATVHDLGGGRRLLR